MRTEISSSIRINAFHFITALCFLLPASFSYATFINFDDINVPNGTMLGDIPLTNQYADKGLLIDDGYLMKSNSYYYGTIVSQPNFLLGGNVLTLQFTGDLPTFVGMYVSSFLDESIFLNAYNSSGLVASWRTDGIHDGFDSSGGEPYSRPKQYVTFNVEAGVSSIVIENYYNTRVSAAIDDLTFTRNASVPEPSGLIILLVGLAGISARAFRLSKK